LDYVSLIAQSSECFFENFLVIPTLAKFCKRGPVLKTIRLASKGAGELSKESIHAEIWRRVILFSPCVIAFDPDTQKGPMMSAGNANF
jgi:hypothetical protein